MNPFKISGIFLIGVAIIAMSLFIFKTNFTPAPKASSGEKQVENPLSNLNLNKIKEFLGQQLIATSSVATATEGQNLTEEIGKTMASKILGASKDLLNYKAGEELSQEEKQISDELTNQLKNKNYLPLNQPIDEKSLKIAADSVSAKKQYLESLVAINQECFKNFDKSVSNVLKDAFEKGDTSSSKKLSENYNCVFNDLINTPVPSDWVSFHKDLLTHYQNCKIVYEAIGNYQNDPIKASFALDAIKELINSAEQLQTIFEIKAKSVGL